MNTPDILAAIVIIVDQLQLHAVLVDFLDHGLDTTRHVSTDLPDGDTLVRIPAVLFAYRDAVMSAAAFAPRLNLRVVFPETLIMQTQPTVQQAQVVEGPVVVIVFSLNAQDRRLDSEIDIFGNQHDFFMRSGFPQCESGAENFIVCERAFSQQAGMGFCRRGLEKETTGSDFQLESFRFPQIQAVIQAGGALALHHLVDEATDLAHIAGNL